MSKRIIVYGLTNPFRIPKGVVRVVFTDSVDVFGEPLIEIEYLTK